MIDLRLLTTNPVLLGSSLLLLTGWIVAFGGLCVSQALVFSISWWFIIYQFITMFFVIVVIITASIAQYRLVILTFLAISISYTTGEINKYLHTSVSTSPAITTGYIFIAVVQFLWIFVFGSTENSRFGSVVDNLTIHAGSMQTATVAPSASTASPMVQTRPYATSPYGPNHYDTSQTTLQHQQSIKHPSYISNSNHRSPDAETTVIVSPNAEYPVDVVALHAYDANPDDPNELSFAKGDVLQVHDKRGNWWQARKSDGSVGIVPSNYFSKD